MSPTISLRSVAAIVQVKRWIHPGLAALSQFLSHTYAKAGNQLLSAQ